MEILDDQILKVIFSASVENSKYKNAEKKVFSKMTKTIRDILDTDNLNIKGNYRIQVSTDAKRPAVFVQWHIFAVLS